MKIFITGGAGFIGKWLVDKLPQNYEIVVVDLLDKQVHPTEDFSAEIKKRATCIKADVRETENYSEELGNSDVVIHLAAQTGTGQSMYEMSRYVQHNIDGTAKLLEAVSTLEKKPKRIILSSSRAVYGEGAYKNNSKIFYPSGRKLEDLQKNKFEIYDEDVMRFEFIPMDEKHLPNPVSVYGLTKLWQEQLLLNFSKSQNIDYVILRLQNVYGPKQELHNPYTGILNIFTNSIFQKNKVELFEDGNMTRDFIYVEDVANVFINCIEHKNNLSTTINVGSGTATTLKQLVNTLVKITDKKVDINISGRFRLGDIRNAAANMTRYKKIFGEWKPTPLESGLKKYLEWYIEQKPSSIEKVESSLKEMEEKGFLMTSK